MFALSVIVGFVVMALLSPFPVIGPIAAGILCTYIVKDTKKGMISGFLSGTISGILGGFLFTIMGGLFGAIFGGFEGSALGSIIGAIIGGGIFISTLYFGFLGLLGGAIGGALVKK